MQLRSRASVRGRRRLVGVAVVGVLMALVAVLTSCQPPTTRTASGETASPRPVSNDRPLTIVALGDSYAAGEGNRPYDPDAPGCDRGAGAWPRLLGQEMAGSTVRVLACSGAKTAAMTTSYRNQPPQITALRQLIASGVNPDVVTITIGGNNANFGPTIASCVLWKCFWTGHDNNSVAYVQNQLPDLLVAVYQGVKAAAPNARIVVVGYPDLIPAWGDNTCKWMSNTERVQLAGLNDDLNRVARRAASKAGVSFVSTEHALDNHRLCTTDSWLFPVELIGPNVAASAHPNAQGQQAIADAVHDYLVK
jgi:lysophospholipase L1-like esterase